jgi:hypothetical protein
MMLDRAKHGGLVVRSAAARRVEGSLQLVSRDHLTGWVLNSLDIPMSDWAHSSERRTSAIVISPRAKQRLPWLQWEPEAF